MAHDQSILIKYLRVYMPFIILTILFALGQNYLGLMLPDFLKVLVDDIIETGNFDALTDLFKSLLLVFFGSGVFSLFRTLTSNYISTNVVYNLRGDMFRALQSQSYGFYDKNRTGDIMSRTTNDVNVSRNFLAQQFANFIRDFFVLIVVLWKVFHINALLSTIFLSLVPILMGLMVWYRKRIYKLYMKMSKNNGTLTSTLQENITGVRVVKAFAREKQELAKFKKDHDDFLKSNMQVVKINSFYGPAQEFITMMGSVLLLILGGYMVLSPDFNISKGEVVEFFVYYQMLYDPLRNMVNIYSQFSQVQASLVRINSILEHKSEIVEKDDAIVLKDIKGHYLFNDVWFSYETNDHYALKGLTFDVKPGESLAILGATGSGKSTLINLIPRFYDPTKGQILIDGMDIRDLNIDGYRKQIGIVSQDIFLFSRTIRENIAYGIKGRVKQEDIERVAKIASIHNFIVSLPDGYKTKVGERGQTLSGGQKQRIAIARALLTNPRILILDDSLSAVDIDTEAQIQNALDTLYTGRTTFIITQRISTIQNCDRILVLDDGKVRELGTHEELYQMNGIYTRIYDTMYKANIRKQDRLKRLEAEAIKTSSAEKEEAFTNYLPEDAEVLQNIYKEKYRDPEKLQKFEEKLQNKLEKQKIRYDTKLLRDEEEQYLEKFLEIMENRTEISLDELAYTFETSEISLLRRLKNWQKNIPFSFGDGEANQKIEIPDLAIFRDAIAAMLDEIYEQQASKTEKSRQKLIRKMRNLTSVDVDPLTWIFEKIRAQKYCAIENIAKMLEIDVEATIKQLKEWQKSLSLEFDENYVYITDLANFEEELKLLKIQIEETQSNEDEIERPNRRLSNRSSKRKSSDDSRGEK